MAINKAMYNGVQDIMNAFDRNAETPFFSVWAGRDMVFSFNENDMEKGRNHLLENLIACEQNEHTDILKIKFHPKQEKTFITDKTPSVATLFVRVCDVNANRSQLMPMPYNQGNDRIGALLEKQTEILSGLHNRLALLENDTNDDDDNFNDDDINDKTERVLGQINGILGNPAVNMILGLLMPKMGELLKPLQNTAVTSLAGIENKEIHEDQVNDIETALLRLNNHVENLGVTLTKLANYADKNPDQFNMLLKMI